MQSVLPVNIAASLLNNHSYKTILDTIPAMVFCLDKNYRYTYANKKYGDWIGLTEESLLGKNFMEAFPEMNRPLKEYIHRALHGNTSHIETDIFLSDKEGFVGIEARLIPNRDEAGNIDGCLALLQERSKTRGAQKTAEQKNDELQEYVEFAPIGLHWIDANGIITWANKAELDMLGYEPEEYIGQPVSNFHIDPDNISNMLSRLRNGETLDQYESRLRCKDGSIRTVHISSNVIWEKDFVHARCFTIDVTERKLLFEALRDSEERYRKLAGELEKQFALKTRDLAARNEELRKSEERYHKMIDEVEDYAILLLDRNGFVLNWNKGAEKIKGYKESEILGKHFRLFYLPDDRASGLPEKLIEEAASQGKALYEGLRVRKDGTTFWGSIVLTAVHNQNGEIIGFTKVTRDLTERKLADQKLKQYAQKLEFQNRELEQFTYAASHDMKEPLRKIIFYNTAISDASSELPEKERLYLSRSLNAARRMQRLIDDLLTYSRISLEDQRFEPVNLNTIVEEAVALHRESPDEKDFMFQTDQLPEIMGIGFQMRQLFDNLLSNSIKYRNPERRLAIKITCEKIKGNLIRQTAPKLAANYYKISVTDNGIGFDSSQAEKIFEVFQRLKTDSSGTGIGLAICRKITLNHKGFMTASGTPNAGATFHIYLPVNI